MKNKLKLFLIILIFSFYNENLISNEFELKSQNINILNKGNVLEASGEVEIKTDNDIEIFSDNSRVDKEKSYLEASGNVRAIDVNKKLEIESDKIVYDKKIELLKTFGESKIFYDNDIILKSKNLKFERNKNILSSDFKTSLEDNLGNILNFEKFTYDTLEGIIEVINLNFKDVENNNFRLAEATVNINTKEIVGKDAKLYFSKSTFGNSENDPRIFGNSLIRNENSTTLTKAVFTSCKFREKEKCPPWILKAEEVKHDKKKKSIEYKNAWLKIYDVPIIYFPVFFHPDPTVKRQSGFLMPKISNSSFLGSSIQVPYYKVISNDKDFTFSPRIFLNDKFLIQSEYRQAFQNSNLVFDQSFTKNNQKTTSHLFSNYSLGNSNSNFEINLETTSNKNYLKKYQISSPIINSYSSLNSFITFENVSDNELFSSSIEIFEDLTKPDSDSYEFIYPNLIYEKYVNNDQGKFTLSSKFFQKQYDTNRYDGVIINDLIFNSEDSLNNSGFISNYSIILKNINTEGKNSNSYKDDTDNKLLTSLILQSEIPMIKKKDSYKGSFTPKVLARLSPSETKNIKNKDRRIDYFDLFQINRINEDDMIEGGNSLTLGFDYKIKDNEDIEKINLSIGQVYRLEENDDLPENSSIGNKSSDFIGKFKIQPNRSFDLNHSFSIDESFNDLNYSFTEANISVNNFITSFKYLDSNYLNTNKSYISNKSTFLLDKNNSISFGTNKDLDKNLTEYYDLVYEYKNDCLSAAIEYKKSYYKDVDLSPDESIFFTLKIIPFGNINTPSIK